MFSAQQRDILRETLEWARHNNGDKVLESYDFSDAPVWDQRNWFSFRDYLISFVEEVDSLADGGQMCGTTACIAGYIVYITRHLREEEEPSGEEIGDYAAWVLEMSEEVSEWLFDDDRLPIAIMNYLEEALEDDHW